MGKKFLDISLANVESIVDEISSLGLEPEKWLVETALKLNFQYKELRDSLRQHQNTLSQLQYREILAFHYYNLSSVFNELFLEHHVDLLGVIQWMEKCLNVLKEIPQHQMTKGLLKLSKDAADNLNGLKILQGKLNTRKNGYKNSRDGPEVQKLAKLSLALGDIAENVATAGYLPSHSGKDEQKHLQRKLQNTILLKVIAFLEECISNPQSNPISALTLSYSLSKAYFLAGIPNLGDKYKNTSGHLLRTCLRFKDKTADTKQNVKSLILEQVKDRRTLQQVKNIIGEFYNEALTSVDQAYIERKYSKYCSREFADESVNYLRRLKENRNREIIMDILPHLKLCDSFLEIPHPLNQLDYYILLKRNHKMLEPKDAKKSLKMLKTRCFETVLEYVELAKKELYFIEVFIEFMGSFKDTQYLEAVLDLHHLCVTERPFGDFIRGVLNLAPDEFGPHLVAVQQAAEHLQHEGDLFYANIFKEFILSYLKSPEIRLVQLDGRGVLEVLSKKIVISDILRQEGFNDMLTNPSCEEVRFVGTNIIHADVHFKRSKWHGKNVVVVTKTLFVHVEISWDVSGDSSALQYSSEAGVLPDGTGDAGKGGGAGESGGNVMVLVESVLNPENLTIISHGGAGGKGQDGGKGLDGSPGKSIDENSFRIKFPPAAKFGVVSRSKHILTTLQSILEYHSTIKLKWYERPDDSVCKEKNLDDIINDLNCHLQHSNFPHERFCGNLFIEAVTEEGNEIVFSFERGATSTNCQSFLLFKGSTGKPGYRGGDGGLEGQGGFCGDISISSTFNIARVGSPGAEGEPGRGGMIGNHGKNGWDMGYLDYFVSKICTSEWPKYFGLKGDSKISLSYHRNDDRNRIWCPYRRYLELSDQYVSMEPSLNEHTKNKKYQERTNTRKNYADQASRSKATKKKTISNSNVMAHYQQQLNSIEKASLRNLYDDLDNTHVLARQGIEENQKIEDEVAVTTLITRCATFRQERNRIQDQGITAFPTDMKKKEGKVEHIIESLTRNPKHHDTWLALKRMRISKFQLEILYRIFKIVQVPDEDDSTDVIYIQDLLLEKYRFVCLFEISRELQSRDNPISSCISTVDVTTTMRYLKIGNEQSDEISHQILGRLNQYIFSNGEEERKKLSKFCRNELEYDERVLKWLKTFVLEAGCQEESSQSTKKWYQKYDFFSEKRKQGLICFTESVERLDREFVSRVSFRNGILDGDREVIADFIRYIENKGSLSVCCLELLAYEFNVNIGLYNTVENLNSRFVLKENLNPDSNQQYHLLIDGEKRTPLSFDVDYWKLEQQREIDDNLFSKIIKDTEQCMKKEEFDSYMALKTYNDKFAIDDEREMMPIPVSDMKTTVERIVEHFTNFEDKVILEFQLRKLSPEYIGRTDILKNLSRRFSAEGNHISAQELLRLVNSVLDSATEGCRNMNFYRWIVVAYPQDQWINELLLTDIETFFKKPLTDKKKWQQYLLQIENKAILITLRDKIHAANPDKSLSVACFNEIFYLLSKIPTDTLQMRGLDLAEWPYALKEKYWKCRLSGLAEWNEGDLSASAYYTLSIENMYGSNLMDKFIQILIDKTFKIVPSKFASLLSNFHDERWNLSDALEILSNCKTVDALIEKMQRKYSESMQVRDVESLVRLVNVDANTSTTVKLLLPHVHHQLNSISRADLRSAVLEMTSMSKSVHQYSEADITAWYQAYKNKITSFTDEKTRKEFSNNVAGEALAVIDRGIELKRHFRLRDTQKMAVLVLLQNDRNTLAQVATGEGKSLIVVAASTIKASNGEKVDIITSSSVLAKRDAKNNADIYNLFGINVSHNCSEDIEVRKAAYSGNQVVYGSLSDFQRDYLLHEFYNINVLGDRTLESVIIDEVDSMLLDKGNNVLYLSHGIPGLDKLDSLYLYIWQLINRPCFDRADLIQTFNVEAIKECVLYDLFGFIGKTDIKALDAGITDVQAGMIWERLVQSKIIDSKSKPIVDEVSRHQIEKALFPDFISYTDRLLYLITECLSRDKAIQVPNSLKPFVELHLDKWIANAIKAYFMVPGEDYVVDVDRTGTSADRNPNIIVIDKNTGTDQANMQWVDALHQYLQLKHNCKLSDQSIKAVFISNVSYFKLYVKLFGLTGTLGSLRERKLLDDVHKADFVTIPTAKPKQFYEHLPIVCPGEDAWCRCIKEVSEHFVWKQKRSVLIICEFLNDVEIIRQTLGVKETFKVHTYTRDYKEFEVIKSQQKLGPGHIIIATNLAGRGTDININKDLESKGGLHVILSYLPNSRNGQQAFGRAARCGDQGSGQLIIKSYEINHGASAIINLKNKRDREELERISQIKQQYDNEICAEEECFSKFKLQYKALKKQFRENVNYGVVEKTPKEVQKILLRCCLDKWAFWLDENSELIKDSSNPKSRNDLDKSLKKFISQLASLKCDDLKDWMAWVDRYPVPMVKLAKYFFSIKEFNAAVTLLDCVIQTEPNFCAAAHYYKAGALGNMINWKSMSETDSENRRQVENELLQAVKLFDKLGNESMKNAAIVGKIKCSKKQAIIQIDAYEQQCKSTANLYHLFSQSVGDILGHAVMPQSFINYEIKDALACKLHQYLLSDGILNHSVVIGQNMSQSEMEALSCGYSIPTADMNSFINKWDGKTIKSFRGFKADMKRSICIPSKEKFWKELIRVGMLSNEIKYLIVDDKKLSEIDPSLLDILNGPSTSEFLGKQELVQENGYLFLNSEQLPGQKSRGNVFLKKDFVELIGRERYLALKSKEVFCFNSKCHFDSDSLKPSTLNTIDKIVRTNFSSYDSLSVEDFISNKVTEKEAEVILQELIDQQILQTRAGTCYYRLASHFSEVDKIRLTCSVYEAVTKSLLYTRFAYRIAFQKIIAQIHDGVAVSLQLKTKPYISLFWDLYESKVISPTKVNKGKHLKDSVLKTLSLRFNKAKFIQLLNRDECVPREDAEDLMRHLISKNWLKVLDGNSEPPTKVVVNQLKDRRDALDRKYKHIEKTAQKILDDLLELSNETALMHVVHCLERLKSNMENLDVPSFGLKSITEACAENFSNAQEMYHFISNGLDEILTLGEKTHTNRMILNTTLVIFMGICQIAIGAIIDMWSVGAMTYVGNASVSLGISDLIFALGAMRSGYFSWEDYRTHKIESLMLTIASAGIGSCWSRGTKLSRVGNKLCTPGTLIGELRASETVGAQVLRTANKSLGKEMIKQISLKTMEGVAFGVANMAIDAALDNFLQNLCEAIASEIMANVEAEFKSHRLDSVLRNVFEIIGENDAQAMLLDLTQKFLGKTSKWEEFESLTTKICTCACRGISEGTAKMVSSGQSAGNLCLVFQYLTLAVVWIGRGIHLLEVRKITASLLDDLSKEIDKKIGNEAPTRAATQAESNYERFEKDIIDHLSSLTRARSSQIISLKILDPLLKEGAHALVRKGGRQLKDFYRSFKEGGYTELFEEYKLQYGESIETAGDDTQAINVITKEYHENLLSLLSKTRNPKLFADIIRENVPMDMTCLQAYIKMLPDILQRQGIQERTTIVVENDGDDLKQVYACGTGEGPEKVIRLKVKNNHCEIVGSDGTVTRTRQTDVNTMNNNCLYWALSEQIDLGMSDDQFRSSVAMIIQEDQGMHRIIQKGWHQYGITMKMHAGALPYDCANDWSFDPDVDLDLCIGKWVDSRNGKEWQERILSDKELHSQRTEAYRKALQRINEIVNGCSHNENWSKCKLIKPHGRIRPDDFEPTVYDTIRVTKDFGSIRSALYPVEFKTEVQVKRGEDVIRCEVQINTDRCSPQAPHIGFKIQRFGDLGPHTVTGHCLINRVGNEYLLHRGNECDNVNGIYHASGDLPEFISRIPVRKLFHEPDRSATYLERHDNQDPRNRPCLRSHINMKISGKRV